MSDFSWFFIWLAIYLALVVGVSLIRKADLVNPADYYLSRAFPLSVLMLVFTYTSTLFSAFFMVGIPAFVYTHGLGTWPYVIFGDVVGIAGLYFFGKRFLVLQAVAKRDGCDIISPLELICPSPSASVIFVLATSVFIIPYLAIQITGVGRLFASASAGAIPFLGGNALVLIVMLYYSLVAGIRGVVYSDFIQGLLLFLGAGLLAGYLVGGKHGGVEAILTSTYSSNRALFELPGPRGLFTTWTLISSFVLFAAIPVTQPQFLTRYLMVFRLRKLKGVALGMGVLIAVGTLPAAMIGLAGVLSHPGLRNADDLVGLLLRANFSPAVSSLFWICVLAAAMSTADSILFSMGLYFSRDVYARLIAKDSNTASQAIVGKIFITAITLVAFLVSLSGSDLIVQLWRMSFAGTLLLLPAIVGGLWCRGAWRHSASVSMLGGIGVFFLLRTFGGALVRGLEPSLPATAFGFLCYLFANRVAAGVAWSTAEPLGSPGA
jgi:SSS family solute:Na+ symporter